MKQLTYVNTVVSLFQFPNNMKALNERAEGVSDNGPGQSRSCMLAGQESLPLMRVVQELLVHFFSPLYPITVSGPSPAFLFLPSPEVPPPQQVKVQPRQRLAATEKATNLSKGGSGFLGLRGAGDCQRQTSGSEGVGGGGSPLLRTMGGFKERGLDQWRPMDRGRRCGEASWKRHQPRVTEVGLVKLLG
jgi:hypothetical protein